MYQLIVRIKQRLIVYIEEHLRTQAIIKN